MENIKTTNTGTGPLSLLTIAFIILKLCHVIDWSWWWVLSPFLIPLSIVLVLVVIILIMAGVELIRNRF